ncbi:MAG: orotidine-5'-phosphate decarboxylase [Candidatus Omnitrophica bacterium]|nr:orotidine-5'-phosphate decarboxylase [Candidatus Omnitrophota bacterium]MBU1128255.1 orotidine-5'-phosphate decarboxylase [Candidatus Omnitrophota bacterium]MBU1656537.1 orotidine-5'-phosphate decarboxylase [Candidatus Omnitrophota bacterium]MBU1784841.1 orotidine-5'-phosphate decarboxylase [Candidatus Omnitrophota bacterium]MBU1851005.1 orotidine-5'-phosphate decarboxylase [Candidatus Omnitrophota bacterium]
MAARDKLIVALDIENEKRCYEMVKILSPQVDIFKIGIAPFTDFGNSVLEELGKAGKKVFLDLKFHDIPNTVENAAFAAAKKKVFMMNFHCLGGTRMMAHALKGATEGASAVGGNVPLLLGVTILTSMDKEEMNTIGIKGTVEEQVAALAGSARQAGMDGVVASAGETKMIKKMLGGEFIVVTPGIRPEWASHGDQKRVITPRQAIKDGSDYIVVGRPIIQAADPLEAAKKILEEMEE